MFASNCHALLCRQFVKGRDWYDFIWYISRQTPINFSLLTHALDQAGPWGDQQLVITPAWLIDALATKIHIIDWPSAKKDVTTFLRARELATLELWSVDFFISRLIKLRSYL